MNNDPHIERVKGISSLAAIRSVYFIGIGGIGMSAIARYFHSRGVQVSGYDKTETTLCRQLVQEGIPISYVDDLDSIPKEAELIVYTPAIPKAHLGLNYYRDNGYNVVKRSDVLEAISRESFNICIGGTHGKTTITTMVAHILRHSGYGCTAFLGGISTNYGTNFWSSPNNVCVIEADEYDRSFLKLSPDVAIITAMDADHLDIYGDARTMEDAFIGFADKVKEGGLLLSRFGLKRMKETKTATRKTYSLGNDAASIYASNIRIQEGGYEFDVRLGGDAVNGVELKMGGMHNVENMVAAIGVARHLDIEHDKIRAAVAAFKGVKRRFEYIIPPVVQEEGAWMRPVFIDDYAHHPEELKALIKSARTLFPQRKVTVIFQPHLFSRTRDFKNEFSASLSIADALVLLPIYPARELPIDGVTSEILLQGIGVEQKQILDKEALLSWARKYVATLDKDFGEVIITAGAGDIDALVQPLKEIIETA
ncbi:MAG TPA: UDP-N-acetylmuramate--L-alanine ligase [Flavisolibacter sp.]